jgi:hypothetical protein
VVVADDADADAWPSGRWPKLSSVAWALNRNV